MFYSLLSFLRCECKGRKYFDIGYINLSFGSFLGLTINPEKAMVFTSGTEVPVANESIAAPAGVVFVTVGNETVKVAKKRTA